MKFMHLADLHLGKRVNEYSMIEDQKYIINEILRIVEEEKTDGVIIAGDIYDRKDPSTEAVSLFDDLLVRLSMKNQKLFLVSGNHDSAERIAFANRLLAKKDIYISSVYGGEVEKIQLQDEYGPCNLFLLPFIKPVQVSRFFEGEKIEDYTDAVFAALSKAQLDSNERNILVMHQFVTGATRCESEELSIGGIDGVSTKAMEGFDYVALGHLHGPQKVEKDTIRYAGTPLKYSFSEENHKKSVTIVELKEKGTVLINQIPLHPQRDLKTLRGPFHELTSSSYYKNQSFVEDYLHIVLTDEEDIPDALGRLKAIYPYIMKLDYDNERTRTFREIGVSDAGDEKSPYELFSELFILQNGKGLSQEQDEFLLELIEEIWGGETL